MTVNRHIQGPDGKLAGSVPLSGKQPPTSHPVPARDNPLRSDLQENVDVDALHARLKETLPDSPIDMDAIPLLPGPDEPKHVIVLRGLPASGKSTWSKRVVDEYPAGSVVRINNDDLCAMLYGQSRGGGDNTGEFLASVRERLLDAALANPDVRLILVDNTNLANKNLTATFKTAHKAKATMTVEDRFLSVPVEECRRRNAIRENPVPDQVITKMASQASRLGKWNPPEVLPQLEPYHNDRALPPVTIVDVDGTLANMSPDRSPFEWHKVGLDTPNTAVVTMVREMIGNGRNVKIFSGRSEACRTETQTWLDKYVSPGLELHMRPEKDNRPDSFVKLDLFNSVIRDKHSVDVVIDDRDQVIDLWRRKLGLPTFQVADGDF
jgi:predicted kinase